MRVWECDMCKKILKYDYDVFEVRCGHPVEYEEGNDAGYNSYDLCSDCAKFVEKTIKRGFEPTIVSEGKPRNTCDFCKHYNHVSLVCELKENPHIIMANATACNKFEPNKANLEPRKTCNTCVHFLTAKSRCLKKNIPIHENDRDACMGWSDKKTCTNCKYNGKDHCSGFKAIYLGDDGHCDGWES